MEIRSIVISEGYVWSLEVFGLGCPAIREGICGKIWGQACNIAIQETAFNNDFIASTNLKSGLGRIYT